MMKNKKGGFTLVELLAVIVILVILATIGVVVTSRYLTESRKKSYKIMSQTIYEATMNCITQGKCAAPTRSEAVVVSTDTLIKYGYLKKLDNPYSKRSDCNGSVVVKNVSTNNNSEYQKYTYDVQLTCDGVADNTLIWPEEKKNQTSLSNIKISSEKTNNNANSSGTDDEKIICKRSLTLHTEKCETDLCSTKHELGSSIIYGNIAEYGKLKSGNAFDCDVNGDGKYDNLLEHFYLLSTDGEYVTMIASTNTFNNLGRCYGNSCYGHLVNGTYITYNNKYSSSVAAHFGPQDAVSYLPSTSIWPNISLRSVTRNITDEQGKSILKFEYKYSLTTGWISTASAKLLTYQEANAACNNSLGTDGGESIGAIVNNCEFLLENTIYAHNDNSNYLDGYWLETIYSTDATKAWYLSAKTKSLVHKLPVYVKANSGVRPVIEVPKKNISY